MSRSIFFLTIVLFFPYYIKCQTLDLTGTVVSSTKKCIEMASIFAKDTHSGNIYSGQSDSLGNFKLLLNRGSYQVMVSYLGQKVYLEKIQLDRDINLGWIVVKELNMLKSVTIYSRKKLVDRKIDRLVFHVENSSLKQGADAYEVLQITPNIRVIDNQIGMIGKNSMTVCINNRIVNLSGDDLVNYLKSLKSEDIKDVEVISSPPSRFDAQGSSGIVNINLKKALNDSWGLTLGSQLRYSNFLQGNAYGSVALNSNKLSLYSSLNTYYGLYSYRDEYDARMYDTGSILSKSYLKTNYKPNYNGIFNLDYNFSKKYSVGIQALLNNVTTAGLEDNITQVQSAPNYSMNTTAKDPRHRNNYSLNFHSSYKLDTLGSVIDLNLDYLNYYSEINRTFQTETYDHLFTHQPSEDYWASNGSKLRIKNYSGKIDFTKKIKGWELGLGAKLSQTENISNIDFKSLHASDVTANVSSIDQFKYSEDMRALYASIGGKLNNHWEAKVGLRLENLKTRGYSFSLDSTANRLYNNIFPTFYIVYHVDDDKSFGLTCNKRVDRPGYRVLNPFVRYINRYYTSEGNPYLQPYYTNNMELSYNNKSNWITTLYVNSSKNVFEQLTRLKEGSINQSIKYENYYNEYIYGLTQNFILSPLKFWESTNTLNVYYQKIHYSVPEIHGDSNLWSAFLQTNNSFKIIETRPIYLTSIYWYEFPKYMGNSKTKGISRMDLGINMNCLKRSLSLSMYVSDVFRTQKVRGSQVTSDIVNTYHNYNYDQAIRLSVRYILGGKRIKRKTVSNSNKEEAERAE